MLARRQVTWLQGLITFGVLSLFGCSPSAGPEVPTHDYHALRGSIHQIGPPVRISVGEERPTRVAFPMAVNLVRARRDLGVKVERRGKELRLLAEHPLPESGKRIEVFTVEGKQHFLTLLPAEKLEHPREILATVGSASPLTPTRFSGPTEFQRAAANDPESFVTFLATATTSSAQHHHQNGVFSRAPGLEGRVVVNSKSIRATVEQAFVAKDRIGMVVLVENTRSESTKLSADMFPFDNIERIAFEKKTLSPAPSFFLLGDDDTDHTTRAFVVTGK